MINFGIIGTGRIADRFADEIKHVNGTDAVIVCNPHITSAEDFAGRHGIEKYTDSFDELCHSDTISAIYIAAPHKFHYEYAKKALLSGKHVLCEKPMCFKKSEAEELFDIAAERGLVLLEALKTAYCPGYREVIATADSGKIGRVVSVEAAFTRLTPTNGREFTDTELGGSFTEFGTYGLLPVFDLLGFHYSDIEFKSLLAPNGVDSYTKALLTYNDEKGRLMAEASVKTGLGVKSEGQLLISGTKGYILVPSPWWLTRYFEVRFEDPNIVEKHTTDYEEAGLRYEIKEFRDIVNKEIPEEGRDRSIALAGVMEEFLWKCKG